MVANESNVLDFIGSNNRKVYIIPSFQRNYEWTNDQCEELFNDIIAALEKGKTHYLSNFIYYETEDSSQAFRKLVIVDGQQRLTTILLLLAAIRDTTTDEDLKDTISEQYLFNKNKNADKKYRLKLKQIEADDDSFSAIIDGTGTADSDSHVFKNYTLFKTLLSKSSKSMNDIFEAIGNLEVVDVDLKINNDLGAIQTIFEKINSTGKPLSSADLIRNYLLISKTIENQDTLYKNYWLKIEKTIHNDEQVSVFAKNYLILQIIDDVEKEKVYKKFKEHFDSTTISHEDILKEMAIYSQYYAWVIYANSPDKLLNKYILELRNLKSDDFIPLYMYLIKSLFSSNVSELIKIFKLLSDFLIRYRIVAPAGGSGDLRNVIHKLLEKLLSDEIEMSYDDILLTLSNSPTKAGRFPDDTDFKEALMKSQKQNHTYGRVLLRKIEYAETKNTDIELENITVEHFMPQTLKPWWKENLGGEIQSLETFNMFLNCIGNLGLLSGPYNSENSNRSWPEKLDIIKKVQYNVTRDVLKYSEWKKDQIIERNKDMANRACKAIISPLPRTTPFIEIEFEDGKYPVSDISTDMTGTELKEVFYLGNPLSISAWRIFFNQVCSILYSKDNNKFIDIVNKNKIHKAKSSHIPNVMDPIITQEKKYLIEPLQIQGTNLFSEGSLSSNRARVYVKQLLEHFNMVDDFEILVMKRKRNDQL